ncbi:MAG: glycosyltransferase family 39 protein [Anaerolineae bacterium]|nr:glycosyltransferase family 39 protein [Anaerolineae bacterium]
MRQRLDHLLQNPHRLALGLTLVALILRLWGVGAHSYWSDEGGEVWVATVPWPDLVFNTSNPDPPLYRLFLAVLARLSLAEAVLRLPSVLFGAAAVYLMYRWWADLDAPGLGLTAAALLTLAPVSVYYSQEVSQYTLAIFMALALIVTYDRAGRLGRPRDWVYAALASVGALYSYYGVALLFPLLEIRLLWQTWRQRTRSRLIGYLAFHLVLGLALGVLLAVFFLPQFRFQASMENAPRRWAADQTLTTLTQTFLRETYSQVLTFQLTPFATPPTWLVNALVALMLLGGVVILRDFPSQRGQLAIGLGLLLIFFVANGFGVYYYGVRYALPWLPFLVACLAAGLWGLARLNRGIGVAAGAGVLVAFTLFLPNLDLVANPYVHWPREELRPVVQYMQAHRQPGDTVYVYYVTMYPYVLYDPNPQCPTFFAPWFRHWPLEEKLAEMRGAIGDSPRVWFVLSHIYGDEDRQLLDGLATTRPRYEVVDSYRDVNAAVYLLERRP